MANKFLTSATVEVDVDIYSNDLNDEDILELAKERGLFNESNQDEDIMEMYYAFKLGRTDRAMELAKKVAQDHTGRIL